jgi:hypothetical protein
MKNDRRWRAFDSDARRRWPWKVGEVTTVANPQNLAGDDLSTGSARQQRAGDAIPSRRALDGLFGVEASDAAPARCRARSLLTAAVFRPPRGGVVLGDRRATTRHSGVCRSPASVCGLQSHQSFNSREPFRQRQLNGGRVEPARDENVGLADPHRTVLIAGF